MTTRRILALAAVAAATVTTVGILVPVTAGAAGAAGGPPRPIVGVQLDRTVDVDAAVAVTVSRVTASAPVTISWGDGATTSVRTLCTSQQARTMPRRCSKTATHAYDRSGSFALHVQRGIRSLGDAEIKVSDPVTEPTPELTWQTTMLTSVNTMRAAGGVAPLMTCATLQLSADRYAHAMAAGNYMSHVGLDGSQPWERMAAAGYDWRGAAENIAAGYPDVASVMTGWRNSPGHYVNLMDPAFTHVGFGQATNATSTYGTYWAQNFGYGGTCSVR